MPKTVEPARVSAGFDKWIGVGPIKIYTDDLEATEEAMNRLVASIDPVKAKENRIEVS